MSDNTYADILTQEGLRGLRARRSMYIGSTGLLSPHHAPNALTQLGQESISNSIDEFVEGYGDRIEVTIEKDNTMIVQDYGRGIPKGPDDSFDAVTRAMTVPHSSGKFDGSGYTNNGIAGMNGIGLKIINATSKYLKVHAISHATTLDKDGKSVLTDDLVEFEIETQMENVISSEIIQRYQAKDIEWIDNVTFNYKGQTLKTGTRIEFLPDDGPVSAVQEPIDLKPVFESIKFVNDDLYPRFKSSSFLNAGLTITYTDKRETETDEEGNESFVYKEWFYKNGIKDFAIELAEDRKLIKGFNEPIFFDAETTVKDHTFRMQCALLITTDIESEIVTYANGVPTKDGGPHVDGFKSAITSAFNAYAKDKGLSTPKGRSKAKPIIFTTNDVLEGMVGSFELRLPSQIADFDGQTKEKLATAEALPATKQIVQEQITNWLYDNEKVANEAIGKMIDSYTSREAAIKARNESRKAREKKGGLSNLAVLTTVKPATGGKPEDREIFIVEGKSASNAKRNRTLQAILPLRGKIRNVEELTVSEAVENAEISTITSTLGTGIGPAFDISGLQYYKIFILTDADSDGGHIALLLLGLFFKFYRPLVEEGHLWIAQTPLYKATKYVKNKKGRSEPVFEWFYTEAEMNKSRDRVLKEGYSIQRFKGLGEMNPEDVGDSALDPATRRVKQITVEDAEKAAKQLKILLGNNADLRKEWVASHMDFDELRRKM